MTDHLIWQQSHAILFLVHSAFWGRDFSERYHYSHILHSHMALVETLHGVESLNCTIKLSLTESLLPFSDFHLSAWKALT
jgi:hypothetical protein